MEFQIRWSVLCGGQIVECISTKCTLQKRGIIIDSTLCGYCNTIDEDINNVLIQCPMAVEVWDWVFRWCDIDKPQFNNIGDMVAFCTQWGKCLKRRKNFISICYGATWLIWKAICDWVFKKSRLSPTKMVDNVKSLVFTWIKHRRNDCSFSWIEWCVNPFCACKYLYASSFCWPLLVTC